MAQLITFNLDGDAEGDFHGDDGSNDLLRYGEDLRSGDSLSNAAEEEKCEEDSTHESEEGHKVTSADVDAFGRVMPKGRRQWFTSEFGAVFKVMGGEKVSDGRKQSIRKRADNINYIRQLYKPVVDQSEMLGDGSPSRSSVVWGSRWTVQSGALNLWWNEGNLHSLTTFDIQKNIAAAVNSRRHLVWVFGVEKNGDVTGCALDGTGRDFIRQAVDISLSREFVPELDGGVVSVTFRPVAGQPAGDTAHRFVIVVATKYLLSTMHQLSFGRIFYLDGDTVKMAQCMDEIRLALQERAGRSPSSVLSHSPGLSLSSMASGFCSLAFLAPIVLSSFSVGVAATVVMRMIYSN